MAGLLAYSSAVPPSQHSVQMRVSGFGAVSTENTAAGTVAESHGIPYFETITLQSYGLTMEFQNKICFLFVIINRLQ